MLDLLVSLARRLTSVCYTISAAVKMGPASLAASASAEDDEWAIRIFDSDISMLRVCCGISDMLPCSTFLEVKSKVVGILQT